MQAMFHNKNEKKNSKISPVQAGLTGVVIGAAGAAAIALSDEETRKRATKKAVQVKNGLKKWSSKTIGDIQTKGETMKKDAKTTLDDKKAEVSRQVKARLDDTSTSK